MRPISVGHNLTAGTHTVCYKVPQGYVAKWNLCYVVNTTGVNKTVSVDWYQASTATHYHVVSNFPITAGEFLKFDGGAYVVLEAGDEIHIETEAGSTMSSINTLELFSKSGI